MPWRIAVVAMLSVACSFVSVRGPSPQAPGWTPENQCTRRSGAPGADAVAATALGVAGLGGIVLLATSGANCPKGGEFTGCGMGEAFAGVIGIAAGVVGLVYGLSALHGSQAIRQCREAADAYGVANWVPPAQMASVLRPERLPFVDASQTCVKLNLRLPSREQAALLRSEPVPLVVWIRMVGPDLETTARDVPVGASAEAFALDLWSGNLERHPVGEQLHVVCVE